VRRRSSYELRLAEGCSVAWRRGARWGRPALGGVPGRSLPFAGIPLEMKDGVDRLLADEPDHGDRTARFKSHPEDGERTQLKPGACCSATGISRCAALLVTVVVDRLPRRSKLIDVAIDQGCGRATKHDP